MIKESMGYAEALAEPPEATENMAELEEQENIKMSIQLKGAALFIGFQKQKHGTEVKLPNETIISKELEKNGRCSKSEIQAHKVVYWEYENGSRIRAFVRSQSIEEVIKQKKDVALVFKYNIENGIGRDNGEWFGIYASKNKGEKPLMVIEKPVICGASGKERGALNVRWERSGGAWKMIIPAPSEDTFLIGAKQVFPMQLKHGSAGGMMGSW